MRRVATPVPSTAGMPYSRATIEPWLSGPPTSVTIADAIAKSGVQAGVVIDATSTSPGRIWPKSPVPCITRAVAVTEPGLQATPLITSPAPARPRLDLSPLRSRPKSFSWGSAVGGETFIAARLAAFRASIVAARESAAWAGSISAAAWPTPSPGGEPRAQPAQHLAQQGVCQADLGQCFFPQRRISLGRGQEFMEQPQAQALEAQGHRLDCLVASFAKCLLAGVRIGPLAAQE